MENIPKANNINDKIVNEMENMYGVPIQVEMEYCDRVKDYVINEYNAAKLLIYHDKKEPMTLENEKKEIEELLKKGIPNYCKEIGIKVTFKKVEF